MLGFDLSFLIAIQ